MPREWSGVLEKILYKEFRINDSILPFFGYDKISLFLSYFLVLLNSVYVYIVGAKMVPLSQNVCGILLFQIARDNKFPENRAAIKTYMKICFRNILQKFSLHTQSN